jgi:hypothetical protein
MARVRFIAPAADLRPGQEGVVYGPGHETDFQAEDIDFVMEQWHAGKVEILDTTGLVPPPEGETTRSSARNEEKPKAKE